MNTGHTLDRLANTELLSKLAALVKRGNELTAELLAYLAEMDRRRLHLDLGFSSLFSYCVEKLHLSEPAAGRRIAAARVCRRFPEAFELVANGDLHLSALCALQPHLSPANVSELFEQCRHKTRRQVEELLAKRFPRRDVPSSIRRLPEPKRPPIATTPATSLEPVSAIDPQPSTPVTPPAQQSFEPTPRRSQVEPMSSDRYGVHFTASSQLRDKIEQARALASHRVDASDLVAVVEFAFDALIRDLLKERFAVGCKPRATSEPLSPGESAAKKSRHIPAAVAREVYERDEGRCAFVSTDGRRCNERRWLEIEHIRPWSMDGPPAVDNLCLLCRAHNQHQARLKFGADFIERAIAQRVKGPGIVREPIGQAYRRARASSLAPPARY